MPAYGTDLIANAFDALPLPAFVVDRDSYIIDFNLAGARLLERVGCAVMRLRGGEELECVHAAPACPECISHNFVREVFEGGRPVRKKGRMRLARDGQTREQDFLITVAPIPGEVEPVALLILDDAAELITPASSSRGSKARAKGRGRKTGSS